MVMFSSKRNDTFSWWPFSSILQGHPPVFCFTMAKLARSTTRTSNPPHTSLEVWNVLDHEHVETREMSSIYAKQLAQLNTQQGLLLLNVQQVGCEYIYILMLWCNLSLWFMQLVVEYLISQCMGIYHRFTEPSYMRANGWTSLYWVPITHWCHHVPQEHAFGSHSCMCSGIKSF